MKTPDSIEQQEERKAARGDKDLSTKSCSGLPDGLPLRPGCHFLRAIRFGSRRGNFSRVLLTRDMRIATRNWRIAATNG